MPNCGNEETFSGTREYTEYGTEYVYLDRDGDITDYGDRNRGEDETGAIEEVTCTECNNAAEEYDTEEERQVILNNLDNPRPPRHSGQSTPTAQTFREKFEVKDNGA